MFFGFGGGGGGMTVSAPQSGHLSLLADILGAGKQPRVADPAVEADMLGHVGRGFLRFGGRRFCRGRFVGRRRNGKCQRTSGAAGALADHRSRNGEARSAPGASDDGGFRLGRGHRISSNGPRRVRIGLSPQACDLVHVRQYNRLGHVEKKPNGACSLRWGELFGNNWIDRYWHLGSRFRMWHGILGHDDVVEQFRRTLASGRLASTYLFVGPPGVGKRRFAIELAHSLLCTESDEAALEPCGKCESCRMFAAGNHPDLELIGLPPDKATLPIDLFIGDREHRNQEGLCHRIGLRPFFGRRKVAIIDDADHFGIASANCLLKTLEEPPPSAMLILIGTSPSRQLPTIRSRSQVVRFRGLDVETVANILIESGAVAERQLADASGRA